MSIQNDKLMNLADGKLLYDDLRQRIDDAGQVQVKDIIAVQDETPTSDVTEIWLPATAPNSVQVPTYAEFTSLANEVANKEDKVDLTVTFTTTMGVQEITATSDKTADEIIQAYVAGQKIKALVDFSGVVYDASLTISELPQNVGYAIIVDARIPMDGMLDMLIMGMNGFPGWITDLVMPMSAVYGSNNGFTAMNKKIMNLATPTAATDAATKGYVDVAVSQSGGAVSDVQVNGTSVVSQGVANVPLAGSSTFGVVRVRQSNDGLTIDSSDNLSISSATDSNIKSGNSNYRPITPYRQHTSVFYGLATASGDTTQSASSNAVGVYTETAQSKISDMLNAPVSVSGTTPSITAMSGVRYICGEVSTLSITAPASGCIDVTFTSGSTPTVLTVTPTKTGVTAIKWANGFDPTALDANTRYEIIIDDGEWGMAASWT